MTAPAAVFLRQYGELLQLYSTRAKSHHRQMLTDYQNTLLIRELNSATNAALEQIAALTEELETLRDDTGGIALTEHGAHTRVCRNEQLRETTDETRAACFPLVATRRTPRKTAAGEGYLLIASFAANAPLPDPRDLDFPLSLHVSVAIAMCLVVGAIGVAIVWKAGKTSSY
ncbi:hypothetical protein ACWC9Q_37670 [Streptomyces sp. NPDC001142]